MPSIAYQIWAIDRAGRLDDMETAHAAIRGPAAARRTATRQLNHAYTLLLAAEFQVFCRELHSEALDGLVTALPLPFRTMLEIEFTWNRQLDRGNANPMTRRADFNRFSFDLWAMVDAVEPRGPLLRRLLEEMNAWRNAIAHSDFDPARLGGRMSLPVRRVRQWRSACRRLAHRLDRVVGDRVHQVVGVRPWV